MSSRPTPPIAPVRLPTWSSVSVAPCPLNVAAFVVAAVAASTRFAPASICRPPVPLTASVSVSVPPEASIVPELVKVVAVTVPKPRSFDPAASVSDAPEAVEVSVPPPSWIRPSLVIAAPAVVQLRPASNWSSPLAPIVHSVVSIVLVTPVPVL